MLIVEKVEERNRKGRGEEGGEGEARGWRLKGVGSRSPSFSLPGSLVEFSPGSDCPSYAAPWESELKA